MLSIREQGNWLKQEVAASTPITQHRAMAVRRAFREHVKTLWHRALRRRSQ